MKPGNLILNKKIKLVQLADILINHLNIRRNDVVLVNVSFHHLKLIDSTPADLIHLLKMIIGTQGTLIVPTAFKDQYKLQSSEGLKNDWKGFSHDDIFSETFKQMPDTIHNSMTSFSFAAWGMLAKRIAEENEGNGIALESDDLFFRLSQYKVKIIGIGVPLAMLYSGNTSDYDSRAKDVDIDKSRRINSAGAKSDNVHKDIILNLFRSKSQPEISEFFPETEVKAFSRGGVFFCKVDTEKVYSRAILFSKSKN